MKSTQVHPELSPLSAMDEYLIHNSPWPLRVMYTSDPRAYERLWFTCQDRVGELIAVTGLAFYPNLGTAEAYGIVNLRGQHTTVRAFRSLGDDRMNMRVGPFDFEVVKAFEDWRLVLDPNEFGVSYDLHWYDTKRSVFHNMGGPHARGGKLGGETTGYETFGRVTGQITVNGERFEIDRDVYCGSRDHHWGVRPGVGGRGLYEGFRWPMNGQWVEFGDWSIWGERILYNFGDPRPGAGRIVSREYHLRFEPETNLLHSGRIRYLLQSGEIKNVTFRHLGQQTAHLRCGMYGSSKGGTPDGDIWQGEYQGENVVAGETYDLRDPAVRVHVSGYDNLHAEFECDGEIAYGIIEPQQPTCYEFCQKGEMGFYMLE